MARGGQADGDFALTGTTAVYVASRFPELDMKVALGRPVAEGPGWSKGDNPEAIIFFAWSSSGLDYFQVFSDP